MLENAVILPPIQSPFYSILKISIFQEVQQSCWESAIIIFIFFFFILWRMIILYKDIFLICPYKEKCGLCVDSVTMVRWCAFFKKSDKNISPSACIFHMCTQMRYLYFHKTFFLPHPETGGIQSWAWSGRLRRDSPGRGDHRWCRTLRRSRICIWSTLWGWPWPNPSRWSSWRRWGPRTASGPGGRRHLGHRKSSHCVQKEKIKVAICT